MFSIEKELYSSNESTILSRCQRFDLRRISVPEIVAHLQVIAKAEGFGAEQEALTAIARSAQGCMRDAISLLDQMLGICATLTLAGYGLYTISPDTAAVHGASDLPYTIPIVTYGVFRYLYVLRGTDASDSDPSRLLFADRHLLCAAVLWIAAVVLIMR